MLAGKFGQKKARDVLSRRALQKKAPCRMPIAPGFPGAASDRAPEEEPNPPPDPFRAET